MRTKPNTDCLSFHRGVYNVTYYEGDKQMSRSLGTTDLEEAKLKRDEFLKDVPIRDRQPTKKENLYVYAMKPFYVKVGKKLVGRYDTKEEAIVGRDEYLKGLKE